MWKSWGGVWFGLGGWFDLKKESTADILFGLPSEANTAILSNALAEARKQQLINIVGG